MVKSLVNVALDYLDGLGINLFFCFLNRYCIETPNLNCKSLLSLMDQQKRDLCDWKMDLLVVCSTLHPNSVPIGEYPQYIHGYVVPAQ